MELDYCQDNSSKDNSKCILVPGHTGAHFNGEGRFWPGNKCYKCGEQVDKRYECEPCEKDRKWRI